MADPKARLGLLVLLALMPAACTATPPSASERECQSRIVATSEAGGDTASPDDAFVADERRWRAMDRAGCTPAQSALLDSLARSAADLTRLSRANDRAARTDRDGARHMAAFQAFNDALIAYDDLVQREKRKLASAPR